MTNYREILRLRSLGINHSWIAESMGIARQTVIATLQRASAQEVNWQVAESMSDRELAVKLFPAGEGKPRTDEGELHLFVAIDHVSKFVVAKLFDRATTEAARSFLESVIAAVPYRIHTVLTDNGIQFADLPKNRNGVTAMFRGHPFDRVCRANNIEHRLTKHHHPWTNGQVERMNRTIKEAAVNRYFYQNQEQLERHLDTFICAYNFAKRLKTLHGLTPYQFIVKSWAESPNLFHSDPSHLNLGLYI